MLLLSVCLCDDMIFMIAFLTRYEFLAGERSFATDDGKSGENSSNILYSCGKKPWYGTPIIQDFGFLLKSLLNKCKSLLVCYMYSKLFGFFLLLNYFY